MDHRRSVRTPSPSCCRRESAWRRFRHRRVATLRETDGVPLVYVTGSAGSGKSSLVIELGRRGVAAYDEDDPEIGGAHELESGLPVPVPPVEERSPDWFSRHEWRLRDGVLEGLRAKASDALVVLCGNVFPPSTAIGLFDRVLHLVLDEQTLRERMLTRVGNDYGKSPDELQQVLRRHRMLGDACRECDVVAVDATRPLTEIADDVVGLSPRR